MKKFTLAQRLKNSFYKKIKTIKVNLFRQRFLEKQLKNEWEVAATKLGDGDEYVSKSYQNIGDSSIKTIAFYLPQFHPFPENDRWWGKGFTEWTNVTKAKPQFIGHYQPHLPSDLGFYDLRLIDIMYQQVEMAKMYGIEGFCFYDYWFAGKKLMQTPLENFLKHKGLNIKICLCWANENWTRRWDGHDKDILIAQEHSPEDDFNYIKSLLPAFQDERYIRIEGRPLLLIYRAALLPNAKETIDRWRSWALANRLPGLYIASVQSFDEEDPRVFGCDAAVEFPPNQGDKVKNIDAIILNPKYEGRIFDYEAMSSSFCSRSKVDYLRFKSVMPSWDNEARKPGKGYSFVGSTPKIYGKWLDSACKETMENKPEERLIFINAWNEWAEGAHLEPCRRYGYAFLDKTREVLQRYVNH